MSIQNFEEEEKMFRDKEERLLNYLKLWDHLPAQGTQEWLDLRTESVGGSQIFNLETTNYSVKNMMLNKLGIDLPTFDKIMAVQWGNIFEDMVRKFTENHYNTRIYEMGSVKGKYGASSSPDGIGVVRVPVENGTYIPMITLFEFKCLFSRILKGKIPKNYYEQIQSGLNIIGPTEIAIYGEALIRCCKFKNLENTPKYNKILHNKLGNEIHLPLQFGLVFFYLNEFTESVIDSLKKLKEYSEFLATTGQYKTKQFDILDLGSDDLFRLLFNLSKSEYSTEVVVCKDKEEAAELIRKRTPIEGEFGENSCFAYLPWKLFRVDFSYVEQEHDFLEKKKDKLQEFVSLTCEARKVKSRDGSEACRAFISSLKFQHLPKSRDQIDDI